MKAHRTDGVSLTFALIFLGVATWWLFAQLMNLTLPAFGWLVAAGLIGVGTLGLVGALRANRSGRRPAATVPAAPGPGSPAVPTGTDLTDLGPADAPLGSLFDRDPTGDADLYRTTEFDRPTDSFDRPTGDPFERPTGGTDDRTTGDRTTGDTGDTGDRTTGDTFERPTAELFPQAPTESLPPSTSGDEDGTEPERPAGYRPGDGTPADRRDERPT
ncbi:hypothetical protein GCM10022225_70270 [Plantactinospora mayteni]|uniref:Uncharacterized protein n=1 Tax=Plantactinospora mayteni TaxID=566021 RepID=A0ABQ4EW30_9ACTN|nr:hypothetical protein Pma05_54580 [Plantactinospora mayteni]